MAAAWLVLQCSVHVITPNYTLKIAIFKEKITVIDCVKCRTVSCDYVDCMINIATNNLTNLKFLMAPFFVGSNSRVMPRSVLLQTQHINFISLKQLTSLCCDSFNITITTTTTTVLPS